MKFTAELRVVGKSATGFTVPPEVVESFGKGKRVPVKVTINGYTYRNTVAVYGGVYMLGVAAEHREGAGIKGGEMVEVDLQIDTEERTVEVPADFAEALDSAGLRAAFDKQAYTHRKEHVRAIEEAKAPETRTRRIQKALEMIAAKA